MKKNKRINKYTTVIARCNDGNIKVSMVVLNQNYQMKDKYILRSNKYSDKIFLSTSQSISKNEPGWFVGTTSVNGIDFNSDSMERRVPSVMVSEFNQRLEERACLV